MRRPGRLPGVRPGSHLRPAAVLLGSRTVRCSCAGFAIGLSLTFVGYLVDFYALYHALPERIGFSMIHGLHRVTPVHYFTDAFALILAAVGAVAGRLQDKVVYYSSHLEELVTARTEELRRSQERYALAARGANDGLWDWDLGTHQVYYSPRWKAALGHDEAGIGTEPEEWLGRVHPEDRPGLEARIESHLAGATTHLVAEYRLRHADGSYRWMLARGIAVREGDSRSSHRFAGSQTDIDERKRMEEQLMHLALHDPLTGLPNRTLFIDRLAHSFDRARKRRRDESLAIIFVDIDRFKNINDSLGHTIGDRVLKIAADRFKACIERTTRASGQETRDPEGPDGRRGLAWTLARMGGDEFTVLLEDVRSLRDATRVVRALEEEFRTSMQVEGRDLYVTMSTGVVLGPGEYERPEDLLRDADTAMYRAKAGGRARCEIFDEEMLAEAQEQLRLETDLHRAMAHDQLHVAYQPIMELEGDRLHGFEALLRWHHPERGPIAPEKFIPLAEETGLILPLGRMIFTEACRQLRHWHDLDPRFQGLTLSTNLSLRQIYSPDLEEEIAGLIDEAGLDPTKLCFEITENTLIEHPQQVTKVLLRLKKRGFKVAIDDFGTGYSSLAALQSLPVDILKIDQVFVARLGESEKARQIAATIVGLARALGHEVIAEGIETEAQIRELRKLHCTLGQGFYFSSPIEGDLVETEVLARYHPALQGRGRREAAGSRGR